MHPRIKGIDPSLLIGVVIKRPLVGVATRHPRTKEINLPLLIGVVIKRGSL
jgi:hypothetical protein